MISCTCGWRSPSWRYRPMRGDNLSFAEGDLARWQKRVRSWTTALDEVELDGQASLQMAVRHAGHAIEVPYANLQASNFCFTTPGLRLHEPSLSLHTSAHSRPPEPEGGIRAPEAHLSGMSLETQHLSLDIGNCGIAARQKSRAISPSFSQWTHDLASAPADPVTGTLAGRLAFDMTGQLTCRQLQYLDKRFFLWDVRESALE